MVPKDKIELKILPSIIAILVLVIGFSACERISETIQPVKEKRFEVRVGVVLPLTGPLAPSTKFIKQGFDLALSEINNAESIRFKFIVEDDTGTPEGAVEAFNRLIHEEDVSVILGPRTSSATQQAFPIAQANQIVAISPTSGARGLSEIGNFVFRMPLTTDVVIPIGIKATHEKLGYQRVATIYDETDLFSKDREEALRDAFAENGIELLISETFQSGDTEFHAQLNRIKALNPDAVFVSSLPPEKINILIQARQLAINAPFIISSLTNFEAQTAGIAAEGAITFTGWLITDDTPGNQTFVENYRRTFGESPTAFAAWSYTALYLFAHAIENAQSTNPEHIREQLAKITGFDTVLGKFSFNTNGDAVYQPKILIVKNGMFQPFQ